VRRWKAWHPNPFPANFLRHYYDFYCLLRNGNVQAFIRNEPYKTHNQGRIPKADNQNLSEHEAFLLLDPRVCAAHAEACARTPSLCYQGRPNFDDLMTAIQARLPHL
jgi:hypothetical protein